MIGTNPWLAHATGDPRCAANDDGERCPIHSVGLAPVRFPGSSLAVKLLTEATFYIERFAILQDVIARSRELVC